MTETQILIESMQSLALKGAALAFAINILTSALKGYIYPKFGKIGVQVVVFAMAFVGGLYIMYGQNVASLTTVVTAAVALFSLSVTLYEVIWQHITWFKDKSPEVVQARVEAARS